VVHTLELTAPDLDDVVACHGAFSAHHLLEADGRVTPIDFDDVCAAPAALDLATYVAELVRGDVADMTVAAGTLDALVAGYGRRPPALAWYLATSILRRVPTPFRHFEPDWATRTERMAAAAEEALHL
jgi:Ser/Thr protein kinase RdoA (MazF antagonist)